MQCDTYQIHIPEVAMLPSNELKLGFLPDRATGIPAGIGVIELTLTRKEAAEFALKILKLLIHLPEIS